MRKLERSLQIRGAASGPAHQDGMRKVKKKRKRYHVPPLTRGVIAMDLARLYTDGKFTSSTTVRDSPPPLDRTRDLLSLACVRRVTLAPRWLLRPPYFSLLLRPQHQLRT